MERDGRKTVDVIIPVYRPGKEFRQLLKRLSKQTWPLRKIILINTGEEFWEPELVEGMDCVELSHVAREEFDHGGTRNLGASHSKADVMVFMTDDAMPKDRYLIERLVMALDGYGLGEGSYKGSRNRIAMAYARQLARSGSGLIESYTRTFNYPPESRVKTEEDLSELGIKTYFASNVCCAYDREVFQELGGFINHAVFNEDMIYAAKAIRAGYALAYAADAQVVHSHQYPLTQQFKRNFDLGVSQADHPEVFEGVPSEGEGVRLVMKTARHLIEKGRPWLILYLAVSSGFKYLGYRCGRSYRSLPGRLWAWFTMNPAYWGGRQEEPVKGGPVR